MVRSIESTIIVAASCVDVWQCLVDLPAYESWNPFVRSIEGELAPGGRLKVHLQMQDGKTMVFRPTVVEFEPGRKLVWQGRLLIPGVFDGRHEFEVFPNQDGSTTFRHAEQFSGVLVPLLGSGFYSRIQDNFQRMNEALKGRVEPGYFVSALS
ncbi:MAG: SRPBCC domain-containing protein [Lautropia sp.]|nr:SRPBCC domain-containing protein [Lautropia sp.]